MLLFVLHVLGSMVKLLASFFLSSLILLFLFLLGISRIILKAIKSISNEVSDLFATKWQHKNREEDTIIYTLPPEQEDDDSSSYSGDYVDYEDVKN